MGDSLTRAPVQVRHAPAGEEQIDGHILPRSSPGVVKAHLLRVHFPDEQGGVNFARALQRNLQRLGEKDGGMARKEIHPSGGAPRSRPHHDAVT